MSEVTVVGSGASGVHFARALLERGHRVRLVDVGHAGSPAPLPDSDWLELKDALDAPIDYFLGPELEAAVLPENEEDIYGFPPSKRYVFETPEGFAFEGEGFGPLYSFARGGLAETWTAGCYPFSREETVDFPFPYEDLASAYDDVALRIGISGELDDLARFFPAHQGLQPGHALDEHASRLLDRYERRRDRLNREFGCYVGRTRVAALSRPLGDRPVCADLGRCMWGCPVRAFYTPALTLAELREHPGFRYEPGIRILRFEATSGRVTALVGRRAEGGEIRLPVEHLALAAGALSSAEIYLRSMRAGGSGPLELEGLMDNRQVLVPFVHLGMIGRRYEPRSYQYHLIGVGLEGDDPKGYVHGQITTLKQALVHPVIQKMPFDLATSTRVIAAIHAALGVVNLNFHDTRRSENRAVFDPGLGRDGGLRLCYRAPAGEPERIQEALGRLRHALRALGCIAPARMTQIRRMGSSVHYAGLLPMSREDRPGSTSPTGRSREFENLHFVDGITFPFLPAKNLTFTLMANAVRIARADF